MEDESQNETIIEAAINIFFKPHYDGPIAWLIWLAERSRNSDSFTRVFEHIEAAIFRDVNLILSIIIDTYGDAQCSLNNGVGDYNIFRERVFDLITMARRITKLDRHKFRTAGIIKLLTAFTAPYLIANRDLAYVEETESDDIVIDYYANPASQEELRPGQIDWVSYMCIELFLLTSKPNENSIYSKQFCFYLTTRISIYCNRL